MKKILLISIIILLTAPLRASSQKYRNKQMSLISFYVSIHPDVKKYLDQFESNFPSVKNSNADKIIAKIKEQAWGSLVDNLQREIGMVILPISTFGNNISYDIYGFPDVNISKAQRKGFSKFYMKVDILIGPEVLQNVVSSKAKKDTALYPAKLKEGEIKPVVTITLTTYPENGVIPLGKFVGISEAPSIWSVDNISILDGLINSNSKTDLSSLMSLVNEAVNDLSINMLIQ